MNILIGKSVFFIGGETAITNGVIVEVYEPHQTTYATARYFDCNDIKTVTLNLSDFYNTFDEAMLGLKENLKSDMFLLSSMDKDSELFKKIMDF